MVARESTILFMNSVIKGILSYVALFFVSRLLGAEALGMVGFALGFIGIFQVISVMGFDLAHIKKVSEGKKKLSECIGTFLYSKIFFTLIFIIVVMSAIFVAKHVLRVGVGGRTQEIVIYFILGYFVLNSISQIALNTFGARKEAIKQEIPSFVGIIVQTALSIMAAILALGAIMLAASYTIGALATLVVALWFFRKFPIGKFDKKIAKDYLLFAFPLILVAAMSDISANIDKIMIRTFMTAKDVGYYFVMKNVVKYIALISLPVMMMLIPTISKHHSKNETNHIKKLMKLAERYLSLIIFPLTTLTIIFAELIIKILLGSEFLPGIRILQIIAMLGLVRALSRPYTALLTGLGHTKTIAYISFSVMVSNIILNLIFIPSEIFGIRLLGLGATGAALTTLITSILGLTLELYFSHKLTKISISSFVFKNIIAAILAGSIIFWVSNIIGLNYWYHLIINLIIGSVIYLAVLVLTKCFVEEDLLFFLNLMNPVKLKKHIQSELEK